MIMGDTNIEPLVQRIMPELSVPSGARLVVESPLFDDHLRQIETPAAQPDVRDGTSATTAAQAGVRVEEPSEPAAANEGDTEREEQPVDPGGGEQSSDGNGTTAPASDGDTKPEVPEGEETSDPSEVVNAETAGVAAVVNQAEAASTEGAVGQQVVNAVAEEVIAAAGDETEQGARPLPARNTAERRGQGVTAERAALVTVDELPVDVPTDAGKKTVKPLAEPLVDSSVAGTPDGTKAEDSVAIAADSAGDGSAERRRAAQASQRRSASEAIPNTVEKQMPSEQQPDAEPATVEAPADTKPGIAKAGAKRLSVAAATAEQVASSTRQMSPPVSTPNPATAVAAALTTDVQAVVRAGSTDEISNRSGQQAEATTGRADALVSPLGRFHRNSAIVGHAGRAGRSAEMRQVDAARFVGRVAHAFETAQQRGGTLQLRLSPPELGSLRLELSVKQGVMTAVVETETAAAKQTLLDNLPALRERLAEQNIRIERFDVDVRRDGGGSSQSSFDHQQESREANSRGDAIRQPRGAPKATEAPPAIVVPRSEGTGINLVA